MSQLVLPPLGRGGGRARERDPELDYIADVTNRTQLLTRTSPWIAHDGDLLQALALNPALSYTDLAYQSASLAAQVNMDRFTQVLGGLSPAAQRAVHAQLTETQRAALGQLGYQAPGRDAPGLFSQVMGPVAGVASAGTNAIGNVLSPVVGTAFDALMWAGDRPQHLWRTVASMDQNAQWAGMAAGLAAAIGVAAAPVTGGLSLGLAAMAVGGAGIAGMSLGAAITNPTDWWDSFNSTYDGERAFTRDAQARARAILGDNEFLHSLARDVAWEGSLDDLAEEFAGVRDSTSGNMLLLSAERVAERLVDPTDPDFDRVAEGLMRLANDETFADAVRVLQDGKISFGRSIARFAGFAPGSEWYGRVSGLADALFLVTLDPTFAAYGVHKIHKAYRFAVPMGERGDTARVLAHAYEHQRGVKTAFDEMAHAINIGDSQYLKTYLPNAQDIWDPLNKWYLARRTENPAFEMTGQEVLRFFQSGQGMLDLMRGRAMRPGETHLLLPSLGPVGHRWARAKGWTKATIDFADDLASAKATARAASPAGRLLRRRAPHDDVDPKVIGDRSVSAADDVLDPALADLVDDAAFEVRRRFRVDLTPDERAVVDHYLQLVDDLPVRMDDEAFVTWLIRAHNDVVELAARKGLADDFDLRMLDPFERPKVLGHSDYFADRHGFVDEAANLWRRQVVEEIPALPTEGIVRPDLRPTAHPTVGQFGLEARDATVAVSRYETTRKVVRFFDSLPISGQVVRTVGALGGTFTSQVPGRGVVNLRDVKQIDKFVDLGRIMGVPAEAREAWKSMIVTQVNDAQRIVAIESYLDTMLRAAGMDVLPEGHALTERFLVKWHQAYSLNGADELLLNGRPRRVGLLPTNDQAFDLVLPDLRELRQAVKRGTVTQWLLGITDMSLLEQSMTRVWKPAVLMRIGFIPRAAGEELMAFMARNGISGMLRNWGEVSVYRGEVSRSEAAMLKAFGADELSDAMYDTMHKWRTMSHVRPLERLFSKFEATHGVVGVLETYSDAMRMWLQRGLMPELAESMSPAMRKMIAGDERSFRRMLVMGSAPEMQDAVAAWHRTYGDMIMRQVSSRTSGWHENANGNNVVTVLRKQSNGELVEEQMVRMRNQFRWYGVDDQMYAHGLHEQVNHVWSDPVVAMAARDSLARVAPESLDEGATRVVLNTLADHGHVVRGNEDAFVQRIVRELVSESMVDEQSMAIVRRELVRRSRGEGRAAEQAEILLGELDRLPRAGWSPDELLDQLAPMFDDASFDSARALIRQAGELDDQGRGWFLYQLEHGTWSADALRGGERYVMDQADALTEFIARLGGLITDPRFGDLETTSLRAALGQGMPVINPVQRGHRRVYVPALDRDALVALQRVLRQNDETLVTAGRAGAAADDAALARTQLGVGDREAVEAILIDDLHAQMRRALDDIRAQGGPTTAMSDDEIRSLLRFLVTERDFLDELAVIAGRSGFERTVPLVHGGTVDHVAAMALSDALTTVALGPGATVPRRRIAYHDAPQSYLPWRRPDPMDEAQGLVEVASPGMRVQTEFRPGLRLDDARRQVELVPEDLIVNGQLRSAPEGAIDAWARDLTERALQVSTHNRSAMVPIRPLRQERAVGEAGEARDLGRRRRTEDRDMAEVAPWTDGENPAERALNPKTRYYDETGKVIEYGDPRYMRPISLVDPDVVVRGPLLEQAPLSWHIIGPAMRDSMDNIAGTMVYRPDQTRHLRSKVSHVARSAHHELPEHVMAAAHVAHKQATWDRIVEFGFSKVIAPSIDAIVRTPMAMHNFMTAYLDAKQAWSWMIDRTLVDGRIGRTFANVSADLPDQRELVRLGRQLEPSFGLGERLTPDELVDVLRSMDLAEVRRLSRANLAGDDLAAMEALVGGDGLRLRLATSRDPNEVLARYLLDGIGESIWMSFDTAAGHARVTELASALRSVGVRDPEVLLAREWENLQLTRQMFDAVEHQAGLVAAERAVANTIPFIDSHEIRSQFGDYGRNLLPFWYAEENFLKRWAKTLKIAPQALRKGQLTYMGMQNVGVIRTDQNGRDWFVYPGSGLLAEALGKLPWFETLPVGAMFQTEMRRMLPGFDRTGAPSPSPWISASLEAMVQAFPEMRRTQRGIVGDIGLNRGVLRQFVPASIMNFYEVLFADEDNPSQRYASAQMAAIAHLEATGRGLPDNATAADQQQFMDRVRSHARTVLLSQAITAFVVPGAPSQTVTGETGLSPKALTGIGITDVAAMFREEYVTLIRRFGMDEGTAIFLDRHPDSTLEDIVNPLAFTTPRSRSASGAALPATMHAVKFYEDNADWMAAFPNAGAYFLPPDDAARGIGEEYAYTQQTIDGLRVRQTPDEFLRAIRFKQAATPYFAARDDHVARKRVARELGDSDQIARLDNEWRQWSTVFKAQHPIFAEELEGGEGRQRRARIIDEMRTALGDPEAPRPPHYDDVAFMFATFEDYRLRIQAVANDRTVATRDRVRRFRLGYEAFMERLVEQRPHLEPLWQSVIRPESGLDA